MLQIKNLTKTFKETGTLFSDVNLKLNPSEIIFLRGKSGSGKSQFLKSIVGLTVVEKGQIYFKGNEITGDDLPTLRSKIHFISQHFPTHAQSVREFLNAPTKLSVYQDKKLNIKKLLSDFSLPEQFLDKRLSLLSGGERQMIHLIRSLSLKPEILLLDEPISAMDPEMKTLTCKNIEKYLNAGGAVIWVTHDPPPINGKVLSFPEFIECP